MIYYSRNNPELYLPLISCVEKKLEEGSPVLESAANCIGADTSGVFQLSKIRRCAKVR